MRTIGVILLCFLGVGLALEAITTTTMPDVDNNSTMDMSKLTDKIFSANCSADEMTKWMGNGKCFWYRGNTATSMKSIMAMAKDVGCKTPSTALMKGWMKKLTEASIWKNGPMMKNLPDLTTGMCGMCGRKLKCCPKEEEFMMQSYYSEPCGMAPEPCKVTPMTTADFEWIKAKEPTMLVNEEPCNYDQLMDWSMQKMKTTKFWKVVKPLMCQMMGTARPMMRCEMDKEKNMCMCCCAGFVVKNGACVPMEMTPDMEC